LLFGQTGALGTVLIMANAYQAWLYLQERKSHEATRQSMQTAADKRTEILESYVKSIGDIKQSIDLLSIRKR
jgi:RNA processing factor Prp31